MFGGGEGRPIRRAGLAGLGLAGSLLFAAIPISPASLQVLAAPAMAPPRIAATTAKPLAKRHVVRHRQVPRSGATVARDAQAQSAATTSSAPVLGGAWSELGPRPIAAHTATVGEVAGRITSLAVDPTNAATVYAGTADGGVWKTTNGTSASPTWTPLTDSQATLAIGALGIDPNAHTTIYAGTGESNRCGDCMPSQGVLKSVDSGATWRLLAGSPVHRTTAVVVDRSNSNHVLVATTRGLYTSNDGGVTWAHNTQITASTVTTVNGSGNPVTGGVDALIQDPATPTIFWAALGDWCNSEKGGIAVSTDSGNNWAKSTDFPTLPNATRIALGLGKDSTNHVVAYASIAACPTPAGTTPPYQDGQLMGIAKNPDADGSGSWTLMTPGTPTTLSDYFGEPSGTEYQGWFDTMVAVDPANPQQVLFGGVTLLLTKDGGGTFADVARPYSTDATKPPLLHPDFHAAVFTGASGSPFYVATDGGAWYSTNLGSSYTNLNHTLAITQLYVGSSQSTSYLVGGSQDNGTVGIVPGGTTPPTWKMLLEGDGGWTAIDPSSGSKVVWSEQTNLDMYKGTYDTAGSTWSETGPCGTKGCTEPTDFIAPFLMDPANPSRLYAGSTFVYRTTDAGATWPTKSADLTLGKVGTDDDVIHTMALASGASSTAVFTGSFYGKVFRNPTADSGSTWTDITANLPAYSAAADTGNAWITGLAVNPANASEAWATIGVTTGGRVWHTVNAGATGGTVWSDITGTAAAVPNGVVASITVDPRNPSTVFIGTDAGAMVCGTCGGATAVGSWSPLGTGLPNVRVDAISLTPDDATLVAWTHGRGVWFSASAPRVTLNPTALSFGNQAVTTTSAPQSITLTNNGTAPLTISGITASGDYSQTNTCGALVLPGNSCTINVTFSPTAIGSRSGTLSVSDNASNSPQTASLSGTGTAAPNPLATLSPSSFDFKGQEVGSSSAPAAFSLTNSGNMPLTISNISLGNTTDFSQSNNCPPPSSSLAVGASCTINVTFSPSSMGTQSATLTVNDSGNNSPQTAQLSGTGMQAQATLSPTSLTFGNQHVGTSSGPQTITLSNGGNEALTNVSVTTSGDFGQTNNCGSSLAAKASCTISVTFTPTAVGTRNGTLTVTDSASTSPQQAGLSGTGSKPQAALTPATLTFPDQPAGTTSSSQPVTLKNGGNEALSIGPITASGDFSQTNNCGTSVAAGASCTISVNFTPSQPGSRTGTLTVNDNADGSPQTVPLSGTGTQAQVTLSPTSLAFAAQDVKTTSASQTVTLSNTGNQSLSISSITASGDFSQSNTCGSSLAANASCTITVTFTPTTAGARSGAVTINDSAPGSPHSVALTGSAVLRFYFAEGFTAQGFDEHLRLLAPNHDARVTIDYYMPGSQKTFPLTLQAGHVVDRSVLGDVGVDQNVSVRVTMDAMGVVERTIHFNYGSWYGSTDKVGVTQPATEWDFAEGSTLPFFSEYLTLQNPNGASVPVTLNYFTDTHLTPSKSITLPPNSRTTVEVFNGSPTSGCAIDTKTGTAVGCGIGRSFVGVSVQVLSQGLPIIAERPFYVDGHSFGSGPIHDGHDAFGANAPAMEWQFAEGTTLPGFNEFLTLQNPSPSSSTVDLHYYDQKAQEAMKTVTLPGNSRTTVAVFNGRFATEGCSVVNGIGEGCGVGPGIEGVAVTVTVHSGSPAIVAERPIYTVKSFGAGTVAGADDIVGASQLRQQFGFAWASTAAGDNDYLTLENPGLALASVSITYYGPNGPIGSAFTFSMAAHLRRTIQVWDPPPLGAGPGQRLLGIVVTSSLPIQVEKPTYSSNASTYGATDTSGYSPDGF